jgi:hypothetical protein
MKKQNIWYEVIYIDTKYGTKHTGAGSKEGLEKHFSTRYRKYRYKVLKMIKHG